MGCLTFTSTGSPETGSDSEIGSVESDVKAALIYRLASFTKWPKNSFSQKNSYIRLTILGNPKMYEKYNQSARKKIDGRVLEIYYAANPEEIPNSHIVFVSAEFTDEYFAAPVSGRAGTLTIGDGTRFVELGGTIQIEIQDNKPSLRVNVVASQKAGVRIDAQVLSIAQIYRPD